VTSPVEYKRATRSYGTPPDEATTAFPDAELRAITFDWTPKHCGDLCDTVTFTLTYDEHDKLVAFEPAPP
jgi:hypothetical protein